MIFLFIYNISLDAILVDNCYEFRASISIELKILALNISINYFFFLVHNFTTHLASMFLFFPLVKHYFFFSFSLPLCHEPQ